MSKKLLDRLPMHDARMEVLLVNLLEMLPPEERYMTIEPKSVFKRGYAQDIIAVRASPLKEGETREHEPITIEVSRNGLYDLLPTALFHQPKVIEGEKSMEERMAQSKKAQEEEADARRFFLPFEQAFFNQRLDIEKIERQFLSNVDNDMQDLLIEKFWTNINHFSPEQKAKLFYLLPLASKIAGDIRLTEHFIALVMNETVSIEHLQRGFITAPDDLILGLGDIELGINFISGNTIPEEMMELKVIIGPVDLQNIPSYLADGQNRIYLETLFSYLMPIEVHIVTDILVKEVNEAFILDPKNDATARLNFSTILASEIII